MLGSLTGMWIYTHDLIPGVILESAGISVGQLRICGVGSLASLGHNVSRSLPYNQTRYIGCESTLTSRRGLDVYTLPLKSAKQVGRPRYGVAHLCDY
jgi:hypothetical protein